MESLRLKIKGREHRRLTFKQKIDASLVEMLEGLVRHKELKFAAEGQSVNLAVAFSGGCDSTVLLSALAKLKCPLLGRITAIHVHHNLSANANAWAEHCQKVAQKLKVDFVLRKVVVNKSGDGVEAAARKARYRALEDSARRAGCQAIVTAHHQDDQLETFMIQWIRGAGVEGLIGMPPIRQTGSIAIVRPLLRFSRKELENYAKTRKFEWVNDESNLDTAYLRNAIRLKVLPVIDEQRKGWRDAAARSIEILSEADEILRDVAQEDLKRVLNSVGHFIELDAFLSLSSARQSRVLRLWMAENGFEVLPCSRLRELLRQIKESESSSILLLRFQDKELRLYGKRLLVTQSEKTNGSDFTFNWQGEKRIAVPSFDGELIFEENPEGFSETFLRSAPLTVKRRSGGEKIKIHKFRPSKPLKQLFSAVGIAEFERASMPLVWRGKDLIFVAGIGEEVRAKLDDDSGPRYSIRWKKNPSLL